MRYLLTGTSGFVGRALAKELGSRGEFIIEAGRRRSGERTDYFFQIRDFSQDIDFTHVLAGCDVVMHLAARVHVMRDAAADPLAAFRAVNLHATVNLARQAAAAGVRRFVYVSSIKVNGESTTDRPFTEADTPAPPEPYAVSKWEAEQALHEIGRETGMEIVVVRPPLVYGPGVKANFYRLMELVRMGLPLPLGAVANRRSMIYVENLVDALIVCATHPAAAGQTYLVSDGEDVSTPQLVREIADAMNKSVRVFALPLVVLRVAARLLGAPGAVDRLTQSLQIDSGKIRNTLGWQPPHTLRQGLRATADWFVTAGKQGEAE